MILFPDPMASDALDDAEFRRLVTAVSAEPSPTRKQLEMRWDFLRGDWSNWVRMKVQAVHHSPTYADEVMRFISISTNLPGIVTSTVATCYKSGARRFIEGNTIADDAMRTAWASSRIAQRAPEWNRQSWLCGPILVIPYMGEGGVQYSAIPPHLSELTLDPRDPMNSPPIAAAWRMTANRLGGPEVVVVDAERYYYCSRQGQVLYTVDHPFGVFPGTVFRAWEPAPGDYYDLDRLKFLTDGGLLMAYFWARLHMRRKQQDGKAPIIAGRTDRLPPGQAFLTGETPFVIDLVEGETLTVQVADMDLSPDHAITHIREILDRTVEQLGLPANAITLDAGGLSTDTAVSADRLAQLRSDQIPFMRAAERDLAMKTSVLVGGAASMETVGDGFRIEFPELSRTLDPEASGRVEDWELRHLLIDDIDLMMRHYPELSRDEARARLLANLDTRTMIAEALASRNMILDPSTGVMSTPEILGRMGGRQGAANGARDRPADDASTDDDNADSSAGAPPA